MLGQVNLRHVALEEMRHLRRWPAARHVQFKHLEMTRADLLLHSLFGRLRDAPLPFQVPLRVDLEAGGMRHAFDRGSSWIVTRERPSGGSDLRREAFFQLVENTPPGEFEEPRLEEAGFSFAFEVL